MSGSYIGIYDFELMPYALGDVLTWNIQTAIRCEDFGRNKVDVFICMDERYPASIYQRGMITAQNCGLFFNELFGAFGTHPRLGGLHVFRDRDEMLAHLRAITQSDAANQYVLGDYERALASREDEAALNAYFTKYIYFHEAINGFADKHGRIPLLGPSPGSAPDIEGVLAHRLAGKRIVTIHVRLRRLDAGYGGDHTYTRDSDFVEWYEFLQWAMQEFPDVVFVVLGRLQEKPIEFLRLPNVFSLRTLGLGLGHELTLMLRSDLFIGTSSGFAALANFSALPYFITKMNAESCNAYRIPFGTDRLPFATDRQRLVYEAETTPMLMRLLGEGLASVPARTGAKPPLPVGSVDVRAWERERARWLHPGATTSRFYVDDEYADRETAYLVLPRIQAAVEALTAGDRPTATQIAARLRDCFPRVTARLPEFLALQTTLGEDAAAPVAETAAPNVLTPITWDEHPARRGNMSSLPVRLGRRLWNARSRVLSKSKSALRRIVRAR